MYSNLAQVCMPVSSVLFQLSLQSQARRSGQFCALCRRPSTKIRANGGSVGIASVGLDNCSRVMGSCCLAPATFFSHSNLHIVAFLTVAQMSPALVFPVRYFSVGPPPVPLNGSITATITDRLTNEQNSRKKLTVSFQPELVTKN